MSLNDYTLTANQYASLDNSGTTFLAFKKIPELLQKYLIGKKTLDYGCGAGSATSFLQEIGLDVEGVDICQSMLREARRLNTNVSFNLIESAKIPHADETFDLIFSSFVLFEIATKAELSRVIHEIHRALKKGGLFIGVTGSEHLYSHKWLSLDTDFEQNKNLKSGDIAKVFLKDAGIIVYDYFWTNQDYLEVIQTSKFSLLEILFPLGADSDGYAWEDEKYFPPYSIYILVK